MQERKDINALNLTHEEYKHYCELRRKYENADPELRDIINEKLTRLGLFGLWRGYDFSYCQLYELIKQQR